MRPSPAIVLLAALFGCSPVIADLSPADARLAAESKVDSEVARKARALGTLERLTAMTVEYDEKPADGLVVNTAPKQGRKALTRLRRQLDGTPYRAYLRDDMFGYGPDKIAIIKNDDYGYLALVRTDGINHDLDHDQVMERYRQWDARYGLRLVGAGQDWLEAELVKPPADWQAFAKEVYAFCPDVVDQGTGDISALASEMRASRRVFLWWD